MRVRAAGLIAAMLAIQGLTACVSPARADTGRNAASNAADAEARIDFDIPAMPLGDALDRFADISGRSAVFPGALLAGRMSSPVHGRHAPPDALRRLIAGTGLELEEIRSGKVSALLLREVQGQVAPVADAVVDHSRLDGYEAVLQARVWDTICATRGIDDDRRSLLRFSVDAGGFIQRPRLLGEQADDTRDRRLLAALRRIRLDRAPPADMQQPVTLLILPAQAGGPDCAAARATR